LPARGKIHYFIIPIGLAGIPVGAYNAATRYPLIGILVAVVGIAAAALAIYKVTRQWRLTRPLPGGCGTPNDREPDEREQRKPRPKKLPRQNCWPYQSSNQADDQRRLEAEEEPS
jgi:hypothetical protein